MSSIPPSPLAPPPTRPEPPRLPGPLTVARQLYKDWFGKDVQETPTVSYVWTADQFGHFSLGFTITYLFSWIARWYFGDPNVPGWAFAACGGANMLMWIVKEVLDYKREYANYRAAHLNAADQPIPGVAQFPFNGHEIWWNVITALIYFATGIITATMALYDPLWGVEAAGAVFVMTLGVGYWWVRRKITFQQAGLPYLYRFANFPKKIEVVPNPELRGTEESAVQYLTEFSTPLPADFNGPAEHIIIFGAAGVGKSSLATAVGTEHAFQMGVGRYTTLSKILEFEQKKALDARAHMRLKVERGGDVTNEEQQEFFDGRILWPWDRSPLLIIDDVDDLFGFDATAEGTVEERGRKVVERIEARVPGVVAKLKLVRRTIWVLSDRLQGKEYTKLLRSLFDVDTSRIHVIKVSQIVGPSVPEGQA
ncbi:ATP-binding protein [Limnoglobus roseus]|uniref:Uncharacterized protein n=1 Tax=Limnoglobus roseus TaxID=2598579 RepID=A0A5C1AQR9_9BACT|nr:ATP-binding protein [Limnoglobus roseus]QEL20376.1 hypothetical protein PX52LOC_07469 [Limnoglobus roseus]